MQHSIKPTHLRWTIMVLFGITFNLRTTNLRFAFLFLLLVCLIGSGQSDGPKRRPGSTTTSARSTKPESESMPKPKPAENAMTEDDFHKLTDKLTHKIMRDIDELKAKDPNWGKPNEDGDSGMGQFEEEKSECDYECPSGRVQKDNPGFKMPAFKNCNDYDRSWDKIPGASGCCARHQICYHTCGRDRTQCDSEFGSCMESICEDLEMAGQITSEDVSNACLSAMGLLGMIVMEPGCKMYPKAQATACRCVDEAPSDKFEPFDSKAAESITGGKGKRKGGKAKTKKEDSGRKVANAEGGGKEQHQLREQEEDKQEIEVELVDVEEVYAAEHVKDEL